MNRISLTSSMRSNLTSLQSIAERRAITEKQLATGLKVSTAIDNPSSYYTAVNLNNQASELSALLDGMSLSVKNLKNTMSAIEAGIEFLGLAKSVAERALDKFKPTGGIPDNPVAPEDPDNPVDPGYPVRPMKKLDKTGLSQILSDNGIFAVVVENKTQLQNALKNAGAGDNIVVWGNIDIQDSTLNIGAGVKLISAQTILNDNNLNDQYYVDDVNKGEITVNITSALPDGGKAPIRVRDNSTISDITINYNSDVKTNIIQNEGGKGVVLNNLTIKAVNTGLMNSIFSFINNDGNSAQVTMTGKNDFSFSGNATGMYAIRGSYNAQFILDENATMNISNIAALNGGFNYIKGTLNSKISPSLVASAARLEISGVVNMEFQAKSADTLLNNSNVFLKSGSELNLIDTLAVEPSFMRGNGDKTFAAEAGSIITYTKNAQTTALTSKGSSNSVQRIDISSLLTDATNWDITTVEAQKFLEIFDNTATGDEDNALAAEYENILQQYDAMVKDSSYNGVNLLRGEKLNVKFNQSGSSSLDVLGQDALSKTLGITDLKWDSVANIEASIGELSAAISDLRNMAGNFSNYYSVVMTRETFSERLINILNEGADKLILADMNEASAQMLSLQTAEQLATSALSMSSTSSQAILKLF